MVKNNKNKFMLIIMDICKKNTKILINLTQKIEKMNDPIYF